jgi:hypothetical protein
MADFTLWARTQQIDPSVHLAIVSAVPSVPRMNDPRIVVRDRLTSSLQDAQVVRDALILELRIEIAARGDRVIEIEIE